MTKDDATRLNEKICRAHIILDDVMSDLLAIQDDALSDEEYEELEDKINDIEMAIDNLPTFEGDE